MMSKNWNNCQHDCVSPCLSRCGRLFSFKGPSTSSEAMERGDSSFLALNMSTKIYMCVSFDNEEGEFFPFPLQSRIKIKQAKYLLFHISIQTWAVMLTERLLGPGEAEPSTLCLSEGHPTLEPHVLRPVLEIAHTQGTEPQRCQWPCCIGCALLEHKVRLGIYPHRWQTQARTPWSFPASMSARQKDI